MTVIGFSIAPGGQQAAIWADTELYRGKVACGHALKIFANPAINAVAASTGPLTLIRMVGAIVHKTTTFDDLLETLRCDLKRTFEPEHSAALAARAPKSPSSVAIVGWSEKLCRFVGYTLHREARFEPRGCSEFMSPHVPDCHGSIDIQDIVATATLQFSDVVSVSVMAGDGVLILGQLSRDGVRLAPIFDLREGHFLSGPRTLSLTMETVLDEE